MNVRSERSAVPGISVVICTYERPQLLAAALVSIGRLVGLAEAELEIVVVDNSDTGSARNVVEDERRSCPVPITYATAHPPNISIARNVGVTTARGEVVAFLDDDQELAPGWLGAVIDGLSRFPHDVFFGPIAPRFEDETVVTRAAQEMFTRRDDAPAGTGLVAFGRGRQSFALSTANSIFRRARTLSGPLPFDARLGQSGGEDLLLLCRLQRAGCRFGWLPEARASDFVPARRCAFRYLLSRHYAGGQAYAAALLWSSARPAGDGALMALKASIQICCAPAWLVTALMSSARREALELLAIKLAGIAGKLFWRKQHQLYRSENRALARPGHARSG